MVVLTYKYNKDDNDLLEKYIQQSIDLTDPSAEDRLKRIVLFFSKHNKPHIFSTPLRDFEDGLAQNYQKEIEYIIGPHARFDPPKTKTVDSIRIDTKLQQLCIRCNWVDQLKTDFHLTLQTEVQVLHITEREIQNISKFIINHMFRASRLM
jgi:hypothetical protein